MIKEALNCGRFKRDSSLTLAACKNGMSYKKLGEQMHVMIETKQKCYLTDSFYIQFSSPSPEHHSNADLYSFTCSLLLGVLKQGLERRRS